MPTSWSFCACGSGNLGCNSERPVGKGSLLGRFSWWAPRHEQSLDIDTDLLVTDLAPSDVCSNVLGDYTVTSPATYGVHRCLLCCAGA